MNTKIIHSHYGKIKQFLAYRIILEAVILFCLISSCSNDPDPGGGKKQEDDCPELNCNMTYTITVSPISVSSNWPYKWFDSKGLGFTLRRDADSTGPCVESASFHGSVEKTY